MSFPALPREDVEAGRVTRELITPPEWMDADADAHRQLKRTGAFRPYEKEYVHRDGHRVPVLVGAAVISYHPLRWVTYVVDLTARQRAEQERALLLARERTARAEADVAGERVSFLLQAGDLVAAAQDRHELLQQAAQLFEQSSATRADVPGWGHAEAYLALGMQLAARGDVLGARNWIEKSLIVAPDYKAAQKQLMMLVQR